MWHVDDQRGDSIIGKACGLRTGAGGVHRVVLQHVSTRLQHVIPNAIIYTNRYPAEPRPLLLNPPRRMFPDKSPAGFNSTGPAKGGECRFNTGLPRTLLPTAFSGDIDEVAVWEVALSDAMIAAHAVGALHKGLPYTYTDPGGASPPADPTSGALDLHEFAPGTQLPTPPSSSNGTRGVTASCLEQLRSFPAPRYAQPGSTKLPPLSNCMDAQYMVSVL